MQQLSPWPDGAQCAVMLTFDFDAETLWISRDLANWKRPGTLSQGTYGAKVGVPMILVLLREYGLKATYFVPGWTAEKYASRVESVLRDGHEVGHHGYLHEWIDPDFPEREREALEKGLAALKTSVGVTPSGYRSPAGETSEKHSGFAGGIQIPIRQFSPRRYPPLSTAAFERSSRANGTAVALEFRRRSLYALFAEKPASHYDELAHAGDLARGVSGDLPAGRIVQSGVPSAGDRPAFASRTAAGIDRFHSEVS